MKARLQARRGAGVFPLQRLFDDLTDGDFLLNLINCIIGFLDIDPVQLTGPLPDLIVSVALDQMEQFDDTVRTPAKHLAGTGFEQRVIQVNVTRADRYQFDDACAPYRPHYPALIQRLERLEAAYARGQNKRDLTDLLLTLVAQLEVVRSVVSHVTAYEGYLEYGSGWLSVLAKMDEQLTWISDRSRILEVLERLAKVVQCWYRVLHDRDAGGIEVPEDVAKSDDPDEPAIGSVQWLSYVSHSVSRRTLHPEVEQALRAQITSLKAAQK